MPLEFTDLQKRLMEFIDESPESGKMRFKNAARHIQKAWDIKGIDPDMAVFRGITAEEEAATGLMLALKIQQYRHADLLKHRDHVHKAAVFPFLQAVLATIRNFQKVSGIKIEGVIGTEEDPNRLKVRLLIGEGTDHAFYAYPDPPLSGFTEVDGKRVSHVYTPQLETIASEQNVNTILTYVREAANKRNRLLYASDQFYPAVKGLQDAFFYDKLDRIFLFAAAYLFVVQYKEQQSFVQETLEAFLKMLNKLPSEDSDIAVVFES